MGYGNRGGGRGRKSYDNNMSACLFKNEDKRKDTDPGWKGSAEVDGVEYWAAGWVNEDNDGNKRINIKFTPKEDKSPQQRNRERGQQRNMTRRDPGDDRQGYGRGGDRDDMDDDIPF